jgi:hypothetical protein
LNCVTTDTLENFRVHLVEERRFSVKSARNIIDGSLRRCSVTLADASKEIRSTIFPLTGGRDYRSENPTLTPKTNGTGFSRCTASGDHTRSMRSLTFAFIPALDQARQWPSSGRVSIL